MHRHTTFRANWQEKSLPSQNQHLAFEFFTIHEIKLSASKILDFSIFWNEFMDQNFRIQAFEKLAGLITDKVKEYLKTDQPRHEYGPAGISLSYPGTSVLWPGESAIHPDGSVNIMFFFRGGSAGVMNQSGTNAVVVTADAGGAGGGPSQQAYGRPDFVNQVVGSIIAQLKQKLKRDDVKLGKLGLAGWSGGYAPIHGIMQNPSALVKQPDYVGVFDGMHHGPKGRPNEQAMKTWKEIADRATQGATQFVVTHTAVDPGSYASSTDTANWLVQQAGIQRQPVQDWEGKGVKPSSIAQQGNFSVVQLYDQAQPYMVRDPESGRSKPNIPGTAGHQHIQAIRSAPDYLPNWA
jgi:hypothetical protein